MALHPCFGNLTQFLDITFLCIVGINLEAIGDQAELIFEEQNEGADLDFDAQGGRTFLRVLLHLTMHDYPPLVSGALMLLFRHFSQRQEVLQAFKQVSPLTWLKR